MTKIISRLAVLAGFLLAFSGCHLIRKSQAASEASPKPEKRTVASLSLSEGIPCNKVNYMDFIFTQGIHNCYLKGGDFRDRNFRIGANFERADCRDADFSGAHIQKANFKGANCAEANFEGAHCKEADFRGARLRCANFEGADCREADFSGASLIDAIMSDELREYARSQGAIFKDPMPLKVVIDGRVYPGCKRDEP